MAPASINPGYIGLTGGYGSVVNPDSLPGEGGYGTIDAAVSFGLGNNRGVIEGSIRFDAYQPDEIFGFEPPDYSLEIGGHYLATLSNGMTLGGFAAYGAAPHDGFDPALNYQVAYVGAEIIKPLGANVVLFGQVGYGTSLELSADNGGPITSAGFYNGYFVRAGASYTGLGATVLTLDMEYAATEQYESSDEPGEMWTVALGGQTPVAMGGKLVATYEVRYGVFDAVTDPDMISETTVELGVRYMFGGSTAKDLLDAGMIGLPYLPLRASTWTTAVH